MKRFDEVSMILGGCQSIVEIDKKLNGDPIEMLFFENSDFLFNFANKNVYLSKKLSKKLTIRKIYYFNSELKRMSSVVFAENFMSSNRNFLVTKGAPEVIGSLLKDKPENYDKWYRDLANQGYRLLSLAYKPVSKAQANEEERTKLENDLIFVGFLVLTNNLKKDTRRYIRNISQSGRDIIVLTGDHLLTSIQTFNSLNISKKKCLIVSIENKALAYHTVEGKRVTDQKEIDQANLTATGKYLDQIIHDFKNIAIRLKVIARVNPKQKEIFIEILKETKKVLMCGDGTNDVGALKKADVGIALVGTKDEPTKELKEERKKKKKEALKKALKERRMVKPSEVNFDGEDLDFKMGDASIAAPFTNKHSNSVKCVVTILKQGVSTLSCGIQSYKIVTLTSLLSAYSLSSLHLANLRFSDVQNTVLGLYGAYLYFTLSSGTPVKNLTRDIPQKSIFNKYFWLSLTGQLFLQFATMFFLMEFSKKHSPDVQEEVDNEEEFIPTFVNSVMFLYELASMFCISIFNYEGRPFMKSLSENKKHFKFLIFPLFLLLILIFNLSDGITNMFQTTFESKHEDSETILFLVVFGFIALSYGWTLLVKYLKLGRIDKWI